MGRMDRSPWVVMKLDVRAGAPWPDDVSEPPGGELSIADKLRLAWPLVMEVWGFHDPAAPECPLQRHVVRVERSGS